MSYEKTLLLSSQSQGLSSIRIQIERYPLSFHLIFKQIKEINSFIDIVPDDLITPIYVASTPRPHKPKTQTYKPCDDEDCVEGSGDMPNRIPEVPSQSVSTELTTFSKFTFTTTSSTLESETDSPNTTIGSTTLSSITPRTNIASSIPIGK